MSDRLLKESDVLKAVDKRIEELSQDPVFVRKNGNIDVIGVKKYILAIPSVERPQGEWIIEQDEQGRTYGKCTVCGMKQYAGYINFCPDCGARMKGVDNDIS